MTVEEAIKLINNSNNCYSLYNAESLLIECKTCMTDKDSFSIKKDWIIKNREEKFIQNRF